MPGLLSIGISGLNAAQAALSTTGHNISNASVAGFNRQQVITSTQDPSFTGAGFFGNGTKVDTVKRIYSQFLENQVLAADTQRAEFETYHNEIKQIDNLLADETAGLSPALQEFFRGVQDVASNPSSIPSRQSLLSSAEAMTTRFHLLYQRMDEIRSGVESQLSLSVDSINATAQQIAELNLRITSAQVAGATVPANDLHDKRNALIQELNREARVTTTTQTDGSVSVFIGTGQPLVIGADVYTLTVAPSINDYSRSSIGLQLPSGGSVPMPESLITGGRLGGLLRFRSESLDPAQNALGRIAASVAQSFNTQHTLGQDLNGVMGGNFFSTPTPTVQNLPDPSTGVPPTALLTGSITAIGSLTTDDYVLSYDGTNYSMQSQKNGSIVYSGATLPTNVAGISLSVASGTVAAGDRFLIQPTRFAAQDMRVSIQDTRLIAAGAPFRTLAATANSGTGSISQGSVVSTTGIAGTAPHIGDITLTFDSATNQFQLGGAASGTLAYNPVADASGKTFTLASPNISFKMSGAPNNGDVFTLTSNDAGVSDNRNAVALGQLQSAKLMIGGGANYQYAYSQLVSDVGTRTRAAEVGVEAQKGLLEQATATQQSLSGVNLDEEAANLVRFQQAYQASARVMNIASRLFDEILSVAR